MISEPKGSLTILFLHMYSALKKRNHYVGRVQLYNEIDFDSLVAYAAKATNINESNIRMSMDAIFDAVQYFVTTGHGVELEGLGTFSFSIKCKAAFSESAAAKQLNNVTRKFINFLPAKEIRDAMKGVKLTKVVDNRKLPETEKLIVSSASYYPDGNRNGVAVSFNDSNKEYPISNGSLIKLVGANLSTNFKIDAGVGAGIAHANLERVVFSSQKKDVEAYFRVSGLKETQPLNYLTVENTSGQKVLDFKGYINTGVPVIRSIDFGTTRLVRGVNTVAYVAGETHLLSVRGSNLQKVTVSLNDTVLVPTYIGSDLLMFDVAIKAIDILTVGDSNYTFVFTGSGPAINTITANGVTVQNRGSSVVIPGENYHFVINGNNLTALSLSDLSGPSGAVFGNLIKSENVAEFDARFADGGDFKIGDEFIIVLNTYTPTIRLGIAIGGTADCEYISGGTVGFSTKIISGNVDTNKFYYMSGSGLGSPAKIGTNGIIVEKEGDTLSFELQENFSELLEGDGVRILYVPEVGTTDYYFTLFDLI